mgnify:CR=1 FL=1
MDRGRTVIIKRSCDESFDMSLVDDRLREIRQGRVAFLRIRDQKRMMFDVF